VYDITTEHGVRNSSDALLRNGHADTMLQTPQLELQIFHVPLCIWVTFNQEHSMLVIMRSSFHTIKWHLLSLFWRKEVEEAYMITCYLCNLPPSFSESQKLSCSHNFEDHRDRTASNSWHIIFYAICVTSMESRLVLCKTPCYISN
jgi:hypothetical protein